MKKLSSVLVVVCVAALVAGCSTPAAPSTSSAATATATTTANAGTGDCGEVERAYQAWSGAPALPRDVASAVALREKDLKTLQEDGTKFLSALAGKVDKPSTTLARAITEYNVDITLLSVELRMVSKINDADAGRVISAIAKVRTEYDAFKAAACG